jgi:PII-like signaling protein
VHGFKGERVLMRIHIGERDKFNGRPLYKEIVELLRKKKYAGATAFRGIMSFGANSKLHTDRFLELSVDMPIVIECVETEERIKAVLPELDNMIAGGLITLERARVIMYRPHDPKDEEVDDWSLDITGSWPGTPPEQPLG